MTDQQGVFSTVYASTATEPFYDARLAALLAQSRASNSRADITGMLLYRRGRFIQFLEGPQQHVDDLLDAIKTDPRHTDVRVLLEDVLEARQFSEWTMGYEPMSELPDETPAGFRDSFEDLERGDDRTLMVQAARDLTMWFRVRADPTA